MATKKPKVTTIASSKGPHKPTGRPTTIKPVPLKNEELQPVREILCSAVFRRGKAELKNVFSYHPCTGDEQAAKHQKVRDAALRFASVLEATVPDCPELFQAVSMVRQAMMLGNAGISCQPQREG